MMCSLYPITILTRLVTLCLYSAMLKLKEKKKVNVMVSLAYLLHTVKPKAAAIKYITITQCCIYVYPNLEILILKVN